MGQLEAVLRVANPARAAAVVAHPHPLHGGTMHNPVVFHADRSLHRSGFIMKACYDFPCQFIFNIAWILTFLYAIPQDINFIS